MKNNTNEIIRHLMGTADGVFIVDSDLRIHMWNNAAEQILGFSKAQVEGKFCYQIIRGLNEAGELFCREHCQILKMAIRSEPISNYDTRMRTRQGEICWLNMSIITLQSGQNEEDLMIVHMFRDISQKKDDQIVFNQILEKARHYLNNSLKIREDKITGEQVEKLTSRQLEVLKLLARGYTTCEIADSLSISPYTARNHIQLIFQKFKVHTRLEAVAFARKNDLLNYINGEDVL